MDADRLTHVPPPVPPAPKRRRLRRILFFAVVVPFGILVGLAGLGFLILATGKSLPVTAADRAVLVTAETLAETVDWLDPSLGRETVSKTRYIDGSIDLEYEYEDPEESDAEYHVYVYCCVSVETTELDAKLVYAASGVGYGITLDLSEFDLEARDDLYRWSSNSRCALLTLDGSAVGNYFACREGRKVFEWIVSGMYFDDPEALADLLQPILTGLRAYDPKRDRR